MELMKFSAEELSELEALEIKGGAMGNPNDPMSQLRCVNIVVGCGASSTQEECVNKVTGCGAESFSALLCAPHSKTCYETYNGC